MHFPNHVPLARQRGGIELHGDGIEARSAGVQGAGPNDGNDAGKL